MTSHEPRGGVFDYQLIFQYSMFSSIIIYLKEVRAEIDRITWPSRRLTSIYTALVIALSIVVGAYLGFLDGMLAQGLDWILAR
jgi:preprotein translocase SecE subunit